MWHWRIFVWIMYFCDVISQSAVSNWSHDINASCDWFKTTWQPFSKLCCIWVKTKYKGFFNSPAFIIGPLSLSLTHPCDDSYTSVHCGKKTRECIWEWSSFVLIIRHQHNDCYSKYDEFKTPSRDSLSPTHEPSAQWQAVTCTAAQIIEDYSKYPRAPM